MSNQTFPIMDLESDVANITQDSKLRKQRFPAQTSTNINSWQHFSVICSVNVVEKIKIIARNEGFSIRDVVEKYLKDGISRYEEKHGMITEQKKNINEVL